MILSRVISLVRHFSVFTDLSKPKLTSKGKEVLSNQAVLLSVQLVGRFPLAAVNRLIPSSFFNCGEICVT